LDSFFSQLTTTDNSSMPCPLTVGAPNESVDLPTTPPAHFDLVRPGIALYGIHPSPELEDRARLRPAMRFLTRVIALRQIAAGEAVGYGATFVARRPSVIATPCRLCRRVSAGASNRRRS
jgi:alanine racemase